jgi:hypothetical protein
MLSRSLCVEVWHDVIFGRGHVTRLDRMKRGSGIKGRDEDQVYREIHCAIQFLFFFPLLFSKNEVTGLQRMASLASFDSSITIFSMHVVRPA